MELEEAKAIERIQILLKDGCNCLECEKNKAAYRIILNLIEKQQGQLQEKDKVINIMVDYMDTYRDKMNMFRNIGDDCFIPREYSDIDYYIKKNSCKECIAEYFTKKAREV